MRFFALLSAVVVLFLSACNTPPTYRRDATAFLRSQGVDDRLIDRLIGKSAITEAEANQLAGYDDISTLHYLGANEGTPEKILRKLAAHREKPVRWGVALNPKAPKDVLENFRTRNSYSTMNTYLARNPVIPKEVLSEMFENKEASATSFALNPNCPVEVMRKIAFSQDEIARAWLAKNPNLPKELHEKLSRDKSKLVKDYSKMNRTYKNSSGR